MNVLDKLRQLMLGLTVKGESAETTRDIRRLVLGAAKLARTPGSLNEQMTQISDMEAFMSTETASWLTIDAVREGKAGPFEVCDIRVWIDLAVRAGVPVVPAREILHLAEDEYEAVAGTLELPDNGVVSRARTLIAAAMEPGDEIATDDRQIDMDGLVERLYAAMDDVPEGWMVRSALCGGSELKSLSATGLAGATTPEVRFGSDLEIGPGWIRNGNRRRVNTQDKRTIKAHAQGAGRGATFLARPWIEADRYIVADDPHRHGSPVQGPGRWPMEWRVFVAAGKVTGVSCYYPWVGEASPQNARIAMEARDLAQRIVDEGVAQGLEPRYMDTEFARRNELAAGILDKTGFSRSDFSCTLDFIETKNGLMLLEGGPGHAPFGGGHPCAFAGTSGKPTLGNAMDVAGVAFRQMDHVLIGEMDSWADGDRTGRILTWDETAALAATS